MSRMLRLVLGVALLVLMLPSLATAEPTPPASSLISKDAVLVLEVAQPKAVLDFVLGNKVLDLITATPVYKQQIARGAFRDLFNGARYLEGRLGADWKTGLHKLLDGGVTLAVQADGGVLVVIDAEDGAMLRNLHQILVEIARSEAAKAGKPKRVASQEALGVTAWTFNGEEAHAIVENRLILASKSSVLKAALERRKAPGSASLDSLPAYKAARDAMSSRVSALAFANLNLLKKHPAIMQGLKQTSEPMISLLLGGVIEPLRHSNWLALGLRVEGESLAVDAVVDGKPGDAASLMAFTWPSRTGEGALANLQVPRQILGLSLYRDLHAFYAAKDKLFPERSGGLILFENMMAIFFSGRDLTTEVFKEMRAEVRFVLAGQEYDKASGTPQVQFPAFAIIFPLHHPQQFTKVVEEAWQKAVGLVNITRGQKAQAGLTIDRDIHDGTKYSVAYFSQGKGEDKDSRANRLNFRPALVRVGDFLVLSSTEVLVKDLIDALKKEARQARQVLAGTHSLIEVEGAALAALVQANRKNLVSNNMLEKGNTREQAETEIDALASLVKLLGRARLNLGSQEGKFRAGLEIKLALP